MWKCAIGTLFKRFSHIGRKPITFDGRVKLSLIGVSKQDAIESFKKTKVIQKAVIEGPLGKQEFPIHRGLVCEVKAGQLDGEQQLVVNLQSNGPEGFSKHQSKFVKSMWGTTVSIIRQMVEGVCEGHQVSLKLVGIGYKVSLADGETLILRVGFSHDVVVKVPPGIRVQVPTPTKIILEGINLQAITQFAASIRAIKKPEPYNGKGIFVGDETIRLKEGKKNK